ncbi:MAG: GGDEF domain-containing protein [Pseudomonadota bacterium]|nr:GGDEF domain-containing protein [Pseudomonadota bacterium]
MINQEEYKQFSQESQMALEVDTLNFKLIAALAGDIEVTPVMAQQIERLKVRRGERFYADLIFMLTHHYYPYEHAQKLWDNILSHKHTLQQALERNVGILVAALDYFMNIDTQTASDALAPQDMLSNLLIADEFSHFADRASFNQALENELQKHQRYDNELSLIILDIDNFKAFNDKYGYQRGDQVLKQLGLLIRRKIRDIDVATRYGGEEFAILLPQTGFEQAIQWAEKLRNWVQIEFQDYLPITISLGVAHCPKHGHQPHTLISAVEDALAVAKRQGKNQVASLH